MAYMLREQKNGQWSDVAWVDADTMRSQLKHYRQHGVGDRYEVVDPANKNKVVAK
jgi:hypothetical protein